MERPGFFERRFEAGYWTSLDGTPIFIRAFGVAACEVEEVIVDTA